MDEKKNYPTKEQVVDYVWETWTGDCYSQDDLTTIACDIYNFIFEPSKSYAQSD